MILKVTLKFILIVVFGVGFVTACTKSLPYKTIPEAQKENIKPKSIIDTNQVYLYVPSTDISNRTSLSAAHARPFWQGSEKRIKFAFTETDLQVLEVDTEERYAANPTNMKLLMSIPIKHVEYKCAEDRKGNCQNREEENNDISWKDK